MRINPAITTIVCTVLLAVNCSKNENRSTSSVTEKEVSSSVVPSKKQIRNLSVKTVQPSLQLVNKDIQCLGTVEVPSDQREKVAVPLGGIVRSLFFKDNVFVKRGQLLAVIKNPEYLKIQQAFLEKKSMLRFHQETFTRQGELTVENASSISKMQQAEADYRTAEVTFYALKEQLEMIGIHTDSLSIDNIASSIGIYAPISGYVSGNDIIPGSFISASTPLCEIMQPENLFLHLFVPEAYSTQLYPDQPVTFTFPGDTLESSAATITTIGNQIDPVNKTLNVYANATDPGLLPLPGTTIHATIEIGPGPALTLPQLAVYTSAGIHCIFMYDEGVITKVPVEVKETGNSQVELLNLRPELHNKEFIMNNIDLIHALFD